MPNKKKKNQTRNPFYYFMVSIRPQLERQGVVLENGMQSLAEIAGPRWKELPDHEKEVYQEMARQEKGNKKYQPARYDRMDCTGQLISKRVDTVSLNEKRRNEEREQVKRGWIPGKAVCDEKFYMIGFMSLCEPENQDPLPCELGVVEYSLNGGMHRSMHKFIKPGAIPTGYKYDAMSRSKQTHQIPITGLAESEDTYRKIWLELLKFVNLEGQTVYPPLYCRISETKITEICLDWLAKCAEMPNKLKKLFELEGLICDLHGHNSDTHISLSKSQATELLSTTVFDYEAGSRCKWHEDQEVKFCALGTVKRYGYCMSDFLCPIYDIPLTPDHLPERPEASCCTVFQPAQCGEGRPRQSQQGATGGRGGATWEDSPMYGSRDYRYREASSGPYARSGPTYDERPEVPQLQQPSSASTWQPARPQPPQAQAPSVGSGLGRGRGRGRAVAPNQPLRRPNIPGLATFRAAGAQASASNGGVGLWSTIASATPQNSAQNNSPSWAQVTGRGPALGRGASNVPSVNPKAYAGTPVPPSPSQAPPPPLAWQQQTTFSPLGQLNAQRTGMPGLEAQVHSLTLNNGNQPRW